MSWKRRWGIVTALALAQGAIIVAYQGFFAGSSAPAQAPADGPSVVTPQKEEGVKPVALPSEPKVAQVPQVAPSEVPAPPPFVMPAEFNKNASSAPKAKNSEPPQLPDFGTLAPVQPPPHAPEPLPSAARSTGEPPVPAGKVESGLVPVKAVEVKPEVSSIGANGPPVPVKVSDSMPDKDAAVPAPVNGSKPASPAREYSRVYAQAPGAAAPASATPPLPPPSVPPTPAGTSNPPVPVSPASDKKAPAPKPELQNALPPPAMDSKSPIAPMSNDHPHAGSPSQSPAASAAQPKTPEQPKVDAPCPWTLRVEIIKGRTLLTAQTGQEVQFRVTCDKLDLQSPRGNIKASGNVKVESDGLQGACEQLSIAWQADQVVLEGNAELKCQREGQDMDLKAAKLSLRLSIATHPSQPRVSSNRPGEVRGATFLSRSKSVRGEYRNARPLQPNSGQTQLQPVPADGGYDRYIGNEPPRRGSKVDE